MMINVYNFQKEEALYHELADFIRSKGYEIVRIRVNKNKKMRKCQIMIERMDNKRVGIIDCEKVNKEVFRILKEKSLELEDFNIEVSSPGIERPLTRLKDFIESKEKIIKMQTLYKIQGRRNFRCYVKDVDENSVKVELVDTGEVIIVNFNSISEAYLEYKL